MHAWVHDESIMRKTKLKREEKWLTNLWYQQRYGLPIGSPFSEQNATKQRERERGRILKREKEEWKVWA